MRSHFKYLAVLFVTACATSCSHPTNSGVSLNVSVHNATTTGYWVELDWQAIPVGILSPGISKTTVDVAPPNSDTLTLELAIDTNRQHRATMKTDVSALRHLPPGRHDVTISIQSESDTKLLIDGHEK